MHGLNQGNRAAPPCWTLVSSILVRIQRAKGHVATVIAPIAKIMTRIVGLLYVDDTDLFVLDRIIVVTREQLQQRSQASLTDWGLALIGTGGGAKPEKSWGYLIDYSWDNNICKRKVT
jgi:hypothetical protein